MTKTLIFLLINLNILGFICKGEKKLYECTMQIIIPDKENVSKSISISFNNDKYVIEGVKDLEIKDAITEILVCISKIPKHLHRENKLGYLYISLNEKTFKADIDRLHQSMSMFEVSSKKKKLYFGGVTNEFDKNQISRIKSLSFKINKKLVSLVFNYDK